MSETQDYRETTPRRLLGEVQEMRDSGHRLVQIGATRTEEGFEVNYSFAKNLAFVNLKLKLPSNDREIPSVSGVYWAAFLYENELHDLFGLKIRHIAIDYRGSFYKVARPAAFAERPDGPPREKKGGPLAAKAGGQEP